MIKKYLINFIIIFFVNFSAWAIPILKQNDTPSAPTLLRADTIEGDQVTDVLVANGNVEANKGMSTVYADQMTYDKNNKIIHAIGNVKARNFEMGNLRATKGDVADDFGSGKFFDSSLIFSDGSYLTSPELDRKTPEVTVLKKSIYSVCPNEEIAQNNNLAGRKLDLLSIKSRKTTIDRGADKMIINSGIIRLYNFPVFYTPYLNKSLSKERKSGFLFPTYTKNTNLGVGLIIPYYVNISPNKDLTPLKQKTTFAFPEWAKYSVAFKDSFKLIPNPLLNKIHFLLFLFESLDLLG